MKLQILNNLKRRDIRFVTMAEVSAEEKKIVAEDKPASASQADRGGERGQEEKSNKDMTQMEMQRGEDNTASSH